MFETSFDKTKWSDAKLPNDIGEGVGWGMSRIWMVFMVRVIMDLVRRVEQGFGLNRLLLI